MKSICIVIAVGIVAAIALAVPSSRADEVDAYRNANSSKQLNGSLCSPIISKEKQFPSEGVTCKCKGILFFGRWECKPSNNSTTTTTTVAPTSTGATGSTTQSTVVTQGPTTETSPTTPSG